MPMLRSVVNILVLLAVLWINGTAGAGTLSGESIGLIANRYPSFFLPAGYVFAIWSLIYLALVAFIVYQALPGRRASPAVEAVGWWWAVNGALNIAWIVLFAFSLFGPALLVMVALLANLIVIHLRISGAHRPLDRWDRALVAWPFDLYLAWISVALISNTFQFVTYVEWGGFGIPGEVWSVSMMAVATVLGAFMALRRGVWIFPLVVAWALWGIGARFPEVALVHLSARGLVVLCLALTAVTLWTRARPPHPAEA